VSKTIQWPVKTREMHSHHLNSTMWNDFKFRDDDIIISTYGKSGTTWMQQMLAQMLLGPDPELTVAEMSPWIDLRVPPKEVKLPAVEAQQHRRFIKTHLPVDALVFSPKAKYLYIGRDARDVVWSLHNHHSKANADWYHALNDSPGRVGPPIERPTDDLRQYWLDWFRKDGYPFWSFWENVQSWWAARELPNVMLVHFNDLKRDLPGQMRRIAAFLDIQVKPADWPKILEYCSFEWMKQNATKAVPLGGAFWEGGAQTFVHKGSNGRWTDTLTAADSAEYEAMAVQKLGAECARWLAHGSASD
jgi:aryl sulfotransferase